MVPKTLTGAIALVKVNGKVIGKMKDIRIDENFRRQPVKGLGTILAEESPVTDWTGTLSCSFYEINFQESGMPGALNRSFTSAASAVLTGGESFEDNLVLDDTGIVVEVFKKVVDVIDPQTGKIKPKLEPYCVVNHVLIERDGVNISEGQISGRDQSFSYLVPVIIQ